MKLTGRRVTVTLGMMTLCSNRVLPTLDLDSSDCIDEQ